MLLFLIVSHFNHGIGKGQGTAYITPRKGEPTGKGIYPVGKGIYPVTSGKGFVPY